MIVDISKGITRDTIVKRVREYEAHIKRRAFERIKTDFMLRPIPESAYQKCLMYGELHDLTATNDIDGEFQIEQDWVEEMWQEFVDLIFYEAMEECKHLSKRL